MSWRFGTERPVVGAALVLLLAAAPCLAGTPTWQRARTEHLTLYSSRDPEDVLSLARELERMAEVVNLWGLGTPGETTGRVTLIGVPTHDDLERHLPTVDGERAQLAGFATGLPFGHWIVFQEDDPRGPRLARHEVSHTLLAQRYESAPVCLHEGLAEYLSTFTVDGQSCKLGQDLPGYRYYLKRRRPLRMGELFAVDVNSPRYLRMDDWTRLFYSESWALVHYLLQPRVGGSSRFYRLLESIADGSSPREAFAAAYPQEDWTGLPARLEDYVDTEALKGPEIAFTRPLQDIAVAMEVVPAEEMALQHVIWRALDPKLPAPDTEALLAEADGLPALASLAEAGRGLLAQRRGDKPAAMECFRRTRDGAPIALALSVAGWGLLYRAQGLEGVERDAAMREAADLLSRSVVLEPNDASASDNLQGAQEFMASRARQRQAEAGNERIAQHNKLAARYNAAVGAVSKNNLPLAKRLLNELVEEDGAPEIREQARTLLAVIAANEDYNRAVVAINAGDAATGLEILDRLAKEAPDAELRELASRTAGSVRAGAGRSR